MRDSCEVNVAGMVFNVYFRYYDGCKQTETTPAEGESIELEDVYVWNTKKENMYQQMILLMAGQILRML